MMQHHMLCGTDCVVPDAACLDMCSSSPVTTYIVTPVVMQDQQAEKVHYGELQSWKDSNIAVLDTDSLLGLLQQLQ